MEISIGTEDFTNSNLSYILILVYLNCFCENYLKKHICLLSSYKLNENFAILTQLALFKVNVKAKASDFSLTV